MEKMTPDAFNGKVTLEDRFQIDVSQDGKERQFPSVYQFGNNIFVSYSQHRDKIMASPVDAMMISRDKGKTWTEKIEHRDFYFSSLVEKEGILYGIVYFTYPASSRKEKMIYWTSVDQGKTWMKQEGIVNAPAGKQFQTAGGAWGSMLFHRGMQVMEDGSIQGVMYGHYAEGGAYTTVWVKSLDNCATWQITSTIASGVPKGEWKNPEGYCEPTFARTRDGSLLCVMRLGSYLPLFQSRSYDHGVTWTEPAVLPGLMPTESESVDPQLLLMSHGVLALTYGRPDDKIAFSADGCGYQWNGSSTTYAGETTGYTGMVEVAPGRLLLIADQGRTGAKEMAIWGRFITVDLTATSVTAHDFGR